MSRVRLNPVASMAYDQRAGGNALACAYKGMADLETELTAERERADRAEAERDRLLALIADEAMHDIDCQSIRIKDDGCGPVMVTAYPSKDCNCWVSKVARTGGDE